MKRRIYLCTVVIDVAPFLWGLTFIVDLTGLPRRQTSGCTYGGVSGEVWRGVVGGDDPQWLNVGGTIAPVGLSRWTKGERSVSAPWSLWPALVEVLAVCFRCQDVATHRPSLLSPCEVVCHISEKVMDAVSDTCLEFSGHNKHVIVNDVCIFVHFVSLKFYLVLKESNDRSSEKFSDLSHH